VARAARFAAPGRRSLRGRRPGGAPVAAPAGVALAVLIDTDVLVDAERAGTVVERILEDEPGAISVVSVSELLHGVHRAQGGERARRLAYVERILGGFEAVPITQPVARIHAELWAGQEQAGAMIGAHDLWIAATAVAFGFGLMTRNAREFERVPGLRVLAA
jgi:predicted nucleic acid-binding protein